MYKGGTLDGDAARNLLSSIIAREILNEYTGSSIVGAVYFKWANAIKELFPGERITAYYIPACTTATGAVLQARGKLVHQVLNKRRRLQSLGALPKKRKRRREEIAAAATSSSSRPIPSILETDTFDDDTDNEEDLQWLRNSSEPWSLVEVKWKNTIKNRMARLHKNDSDHSLLKNYINEYPALKKPHGYTLLNIDFEAAYAEKKENLFVYFPVAKLRILEILNKRLLRLNKRQSRDTFTKELICLANSSEEDDKNLAAFLSIPYLMTTSTVKLKGKANSWKLSKAESRDAFIKHVKSDCDIVSYIELRLQTLRTKEVASQPYIIIIGESLNDIKTYLVVVNKSVKYQRSNIMEAVDSCYKAFWAFNAEYGIDSHAVWYFIQKGLYKMSSQYDRGPTAAESLLTDCNIS